MSRYVGTLGSTRTSTTTTVRTSSTGTPPTTLPITSLLPSSTVRRTAISSSKAEMPTHVVSSGGTIVASSATEPSTGKGKWVLAGLGLFGLGGLILLVRKKGK